MAVQGQRWHPIWCVQGHSKSHTVSLLLPPSFPAHPLFLPSPPPPPLSLLTLCVITILLSSLPVLTGRGFTHTQMCCGWIIWPQRPALKPTSRDLATNVGRAILSPSSLVYWTVSLARTCFWMCSPLKKWRRRDQGYNHIINHSVYNYYDIITFRLSLVIYFFTTSIFFFLNSWSPIHPLIPEPRYPLLLIGQIIGHSICWEVVSLLFWVFFHSFVIQLLYQVCDDKIIIIVNGTDRNMKIRQHIML